MEQPLLVFRIAEEIKIYTCFANLVKFGLIFMLFGHFSQGFEVKEFIFGVKKNQNYEPGKKLAKNSGKEKKWVSTSI